MWNGSKRVDGSFLEDVIRPISDGTTGLYYVPGSSISEGASGGVGAFSNNKSAWTVNYRPDNSGGVVADNVLFRIGTNEPIVERGSPSADTYVATIATPSKTQSGNSVFVGFNIGSINLTATDQVTKSHEQAILEMDKLDIFQNGGAVTYQKAVNTRFRLAVAHTGVTIVDNYAISGVVPDPLAGGAYTNVFWAKFLGLNPTTVPGATNHYGVFFAGAIPGGHIASGGGIDLLVKANADGGGEADLLLDTGAGGLVKARVNGLTVMEFDGSEAQHKNFVQLHANTTPTFQAASDAGDANVGMAIYSKGGFSVQIGTGAGVDQFKVAHTASAVNQVQVTGGATGNPATVTVAAVGSDSNIHLAWIPKGTGAVVAGAPVRLPSYTVATLPSASIAGVGALAVVTDATQTMITGLGITLTGGGSNKVPVMSDGTNWLGL